MQILPQLPGIRRVWYVSFLTPSLWFLGWVIVVYVDIRNLVGWKFAFSVEQKLWSSFVKYNLHCKYQPKCVFWRGFTIVRTGPSESRSRKRRTSLGSVKKLRRVRYGKPGILPQCWAAFCAVIVVYLQSSPRYSETKFCNYLNVCIMPNIEKLPHSVVCRHTLRVSMKGR